jgi:hypothetical protein
MTIAPAAPVPARAGAPAPRTPVVAGVFFAISTLICLAAGASLLTPGGPLEWMWRIKPAEYRQMLAMGPLAGAGFLALALAMAAASAGTFGRRRWGWRLAMGIFAVNGLGDAARIFTGAWTEGIFGVFMAALILWWLARPGVRAVFDR